jgi:hypothetical protein
MAVHIVNTAEETLSAQQGRLTPYRLGGLDLPPLRSHYVLMNEGDGQLHTLTVLEQLREASKSLWGASSAAYFRVDELLRQLANPNLHDIPRNLPFRVEMRDQSDQRAVRCSLGNLRIRGDATRPHPSHQAEAWLSLEAGAFDFVPTVRTGPP